MGLGDADLLEDRDGGGGEVLASSVSCSICLDLVTDNGERSWAKLQCGHQFHLDCIGSAFNVKGVMQCPNCRKIEKGQWLQANGNCLRPLFSMDDWVYDEDVYDLGYSGMSFGLHWCPFSGLTRLPSSFDEGEFSSTAYHGIGHHAGFAEHAPVSSSTHPCPYHAYFGPIHPCYSPATASVSNVSSFNGHWSSSSVPTEVTNSYDSPSMDVHYHHWDHSSPFDTSNHIGAADQSIPSVTPRTVRNSSGVPRPGIHPFIVGHSSASRVQSSSVLPPYPGTVGWPHDHASFLQAYLQQSTSNPAAHTPVTSSRQRSSSHRGLAHVAPVASSSYQSSFYILSSLSGRTFQEAAYLNESPFNSWNRQHQPSFPFTQVNRDSIWRPFHSPASISDAGIRLSSFLQRHGAERVPSQN